MFIYKSKASLNVKIVFVKITHLLDQEIRKMLVWGFYENEFPHSILVHFMNQPAVVK